MTSIRTETSVVTSVPITDSPDNTFIFDLEFHGLPSSMEEHIEFVKQSVGAHFLLLQQFLEFRAQSLDFDVNWNTAKFKIEDISNG